jgi:antitoxin component YwqK of YwqJK toxin-antitoxin module
LAEKVNHNTNKTKVDIMLVDKEGNTKININPEVETITTTEEVVEVATEVEEVVTKEVAICNNKCPTNSTNNNKHSSNQASVKAIPKCSNKMFRETTIPSNSNKQDPNNSQCKLLCLNMMSKHLQ